MASNRFRCSRIRGTRLGGLGAAAALLWASGGCLPGTGAAAWGVNQPPPLAYHATVRSDGLTGSAFLIAEGTAATNAHVLGGARVGAHVVLEQRTDDQVIETRARVLAVSERIDLALLAVPRGALPIVPMSGARVRIGQSVRAAGVVARHGEPGPRLELRGRVASSILTLRPFGPGFVATMPGIRRGFSGGPVFDELGQLVGMIAALRPDPAQMRNAAGRPLAGREAFILAAPTLRAEAARLLAEISER